MALEREPHPRTIATLDKLESVIWFSKVGEPDFETAIVLESWDQAIARAKSREWDDLIIEAANRLREGVLAKNRERYREWNDTVATIRPFAQALTREKIAEAIEDAALCENILRSAGWSIIHLCMESEFIDVVEPGFFHSLSYYYVKGHFPCGFEGPISSGRQVVF